MTCRVSDASKCRPLESSLGRRFSVSAIALRIRASPEPETAQSTTMPDEPSTPEICDRPPEKHEQLSATPGNLTLSRPCKGLLLPFVDDLRSQIPPEKGPSRLSGSLWRWCVDARNFRGNQILSLFSRFANSAVSSRN